MGALLRILFQAIVLRGTNTYRWDIEFSLLCKAVVVTVKKAARAIVTWIDYSRISYSILSVSPRKSVLARHLPARSPPDDLAFFDPGWCYAEEMNTEFRVIGVSVVGSSGCLWLWEDACLPLWDLYRPETSILALSSVSFTLALETWPLRQLDPLIIKSFPLLTLLKPYSLLQKKC